VSATPTDLPDIIWGIEAIGRAAGCVDADGNVEVRKVKYRLARGYIPGRKVGRKWQSARSWIDREMVSLLGEELSTTA
jgi:hypothetical protein